MTRLTTLAAAEARLLMRDWTVLVFAFVFPPFVMVILAQCFVQGLETFSSLKAIGDMQGELRAATSLARLWRDQRRVAEARELLAPVYGRFIEGFGTADLREARALLEQLP